MIKQYEKLSQNGIKFSESIKDTYNELVNADENISSERFNYLVGRLSATMDAVVPRASVASEVVKKIGADIEDNRLPHREATRNDNVIDSIAVVDGMWDDGRNSGKSGYAENVEKSQLESVENL